MISQLLHQVMTECRLKQADLALVLEVSLSRVKAMTSGRVQKLSTDETRHLVRKLGLNAHWLATGEGAMFSRDESHDEFTNRMQAINRVAELIKAMPLPDLAKAQLCAVMSGNAAHDAPLIAQALAMQALSPTQRELISAFEGCSREGQQHLIQTAKLLSTGMPLAPAISPKREETLEGRTVVDGVSNEVDSDHAFVEIKGNRNRVRTGRK